LFANGARWARYRGAAKEKLETDVFVNSLKMFTLLATNVFPVIKHVWSEQVRAD